MAETKAQQLARYLHEIETTEGSMWFDTAMLSLEVPVIGLLGKAAKTAKSSVPTQAQMDAMALAREQSITQEVIDLAPPDTTALRKATERAEKSKEYSEQLKKDYTKSFHDEKYSTLSFRKASEELSDYARRFNRNHLVQKIPEMEAELYAPFQDEYVRYAMNLPEGKRPMSLQQYADISMREYVSADEFFPAGSMELEQFRIKKEIIEDIKRDPSLYVDDFGGLDMQQLRFFATLDESPKALRIDPRGQELFENRRLAIVEMRKHQSPEMIRENLYKFNTTILEDDLFLQDVHETIADDAWMNLKGELQKRGYSDELVDSIVGRKQAAQIDKRNIDFWKEISNELMYSRSLQDFDPSYLGDLKKGDMPDIMQKYLTGNLDDRVQDIMTDASYKKLRDKAIEMEHVPMEKARRYPEPELIVDEIMTRQHQAHDAQLMNALKNYGQARARFMYSFLPVVPTAESLYSGYQKKEDLMGRAEELKKDMTPEEIKEAEERLIDIKGTRKYLGPDPVTGEYPALPEQPVSPSSFGQLSEGEEMSVIEFIKSIPEYNEEDDIMYQSFKPKKKR
jgi:hypothetical protein